MTTISISALPAKTGTINDAAYLHLNESSVDKKVSIIQLLAKISDQYTTDIVTFLGSADSAAARTSLGIDRRTTVSDANYTILATDKVVAQNGTMSAPRSFYLPLANTVEAGSEIIIIDESGSVNSTNKIRVYRTGSDTLDNLTYFDIVGTYGSLRLISNGSNAWKLVNNFHVPTGDISAHASTTMPYGYLECNGASLSKTTYANLYAAIGDTWGSGSTYFYLPDLRDRFIRGKSSSRSLGSYQADAFKSHTHSVPEGTITGGGTGDYTSGDDYTNNIFRYSTTLSTGDIETRPKNVALVYKIKYL